MNDLMKCLYDFLQKRRMGRLHDDPEYTEVSRDVELQLKKVRQSMTDEQQLELSLLLTSLSAQNSIESEHTFLAALSLARELTRTPA